MIQKQYLNYNLGDSQLRSHIDAVHSQRPRADKYTGEIVLGVTQKINASSIVATVSRTVMDINRPRNTVNAPAIDEYRKTINEIITPKNILDENYTLNRNYLHLAIHGMNDKYGIDFEIGTRHGNSCSLEIKDWFMCELKKNSTNVGLNSIFPGDSSKVFHRVGDSSSNYQGYGEFFNTIQIEINNEWRTNRRTELIDFFSKIIIDFENYF